jgi:hypothetical protein
LKNPTPARLAARLQASQGIDAVAKYLAIDDRADISMREITQGFVIAFDLVDVTTKHLSFLPHRQL